VNELTLSQASRQFGVPVSTLRWAAAAERLRARKIGAQWVTTAAAVEKWKTDESKHRRGPKARK
jgi:hypothetical protein